MASVSSHWPLEARTGRLLSQGAATRPACQVTQNLVADIGTVPPLRVCVKGKTQSPVLDPHSHRQSTFFLVGSVVENQKWDATSIERAARQAPGREGSLLLQILPRAAQEVEFNLQLGEDHVEAFELDSQGLPSASPHGSGAAGELGWG